VKGKAGGAGRRGVDTAHTAAGNNHRGGEVGAVGPWGTGGPPGIYYGDGAGWPPTAAAAAVAAAAAAREQVRVLGD
jgi:hypothetical protein